MPFWQPTTLDPTGSTPIVTGGTYLVTGGLGGMGYSLARWLAETHDARLIVVTSEPVPPPRSARALSRYPYVGPPGTRRLRRLATLEDVAPSVEVVTGDVADANTIASIVHDVCENMDASTA